MYVCGGKLKGTVFRCTLLVTLPILKEIFWGGGGGGGLPIPVTLKLL